MQSVCHVSVRNIVGSAAQWCSCRLSLGPACSCLLMQQAAAAAAAGDDDGGGDDESDSRTGGRWSAALAHGHSRVSVGRSLVRTPSIR